MSEEQLIRPESYSGVPLPQSLEAERSVLGALLQDGKAVSMAMEMLREDDFYSPVHQAIFAAVRALAQQSTAVDLITANDELARRGTLDGIGGTEYLVRLMEDVPATSNVQYYISIVLQKSTLRQLIRASAQITRARSCRSARVSSIPAYRVDSISGVTST